MIKANRYTRAADIYSNGVLLHTVIAEFLPFHDENVNRLLQQIVSTQPTLAKGLSPELTDLLQKMMCNQCNQRIDMQPIKAHPWFSQSEHGIMLQLTPDQNSALADTRGREGRLAD
jgi:serine/threonine protein kinase